MIQGKDEAMSIPILLADDHKIMREGLKSLLSKEQGMEVVGEQPGSRVSVLAKDRRGLRIR